MGALVVSLGLFGAGCAPLVEINVGSTNSSTTPSTATTTTSSVAAVVPATTTVTPTATPVVPVKPRQTLKNWLASFQTHGSQAEIDLKKFKPVFQITYGIPNSDGIKNVVLYSENGWKDGSEKSMYFALDESSPADENPNYVFYGPSRDRVAGLINEAKNYKQGEIINDGYRFSSVLWYQK